MQIMDVLTFREQYAAPVVGQGATLICYSDRYAYTIVRVSASGKTAELERDIRKPLHQGRTESQRYEYFRDVGGTPATARLTKKGWTSNGMKVLMGVRDEFYDYNF